MSKSGSKAIRASALFTRAVTAIDQNDTKLATAKFREIAEDSSLPKPYRDLALIRQTALEFDQIPASRWCRGSSPWPGPASHGSGPPAK